MRLIMYAVALMCCCTMSPVRSFGEQRITLLNEFDEKTGHDNHMIAVQLFGDHTEITYCDGTDTAHLLPLLQTLQSGSRQPITLRMVGFHEFDIDNRGWVIVGVCNRVKDADAGIYVWSSHDVARSTARSLGASFKQMRNLPVELRSRNELTEYFTPEAGD
ncbi:hypothetical protein LOC67_24805 [Stieleria sp. JC731]|uniref:hypothetical protein n=1 Tax=Stieleria sp. JC731 TaxID=2894195 RepID=UPI001E431B9D|nr:hypothetical protein [Stieleria sp. JC731]MCC9603784.1 hypothetical protein [Stieleria sp. JC731]